MAADKSAGWISFAVLLACLCAGAMLFCRNGGNDGGACRARIAAVDNSDISTLGFVKYGTQRLQAVALEGPRKGETLELGNTVRGQLELDTVFKPGDEALVSGGGVRLWRAGSIACAFAVFALMLAAFGGRVGVNALSSFTICCIIIWKIAIPLMLKGWAASWVAFISTAAMTGVIMLLVGGFTRKALAAFGGSMLGVGAGLGCAHLLGGIAQINGATLPYVQTLLYSGCANLDLADVFVAATVFASSGAIMDLAMDIAAGVAEVARHNHALGFRALAMSGIRIGRATVGTMSTTLLLAYSGGFLTLLMVFAAQGTPPQEFLNSPVVAAEAVKTLVGSFAIVLVAPFTALLSGLLFRASARA